MPIDYQSKTDRYPTRVTINSSLQKGTKDSCIWRINVDCDIGIAIHQVFSALPGGIIAGGFTLAEFNGIRKNQMGPDVVYKQVEARVGGL